MECHRRDLKRIRFSLLKKKKKKAILAAVFTGVFVGTGARMATLRALGGGWPRLCEQ